MATMERLNDAKESAVREKEKLRTEKDASRQRKAAEKEARAVVLAEARARRLEEKEEEARVKALHVAEVASARAAKAAEKARRTSRQGRTATEVAQGHQVDRHEAETTQVMSEAQAPLQDFLSMLEVLQTLTSHTLQHLWECNTFTSSLSTNLVPVCYLCHQSPSLNQFCSLHHCSTRLTYFSRKDGHLQRGEGGGQGKKLTPWGVYFAS